MSFSPHNDQRPTPRELIIAVLLTGFMFYYAIDLRGWFGWELWIAPLPLLLIAFRVSGWKLFTCAFAGCLIGRINWIPYLARVMPLAPAILISVLIALLYAAVMVGTRRIVLARNNFIAVFAYPVLITAAEFVSLSLSYDGSAGSLAYTQSNYLSIIQVASVTGIWGIVFVTALIPSTLAIAWHLSANPHQAQRTLLTGSFLVLAIIGFGWIRLSQTRAHDRLRVGLTVISESLHLFTSTPVLASEEKVARDYLGQIKPLALQGARLVLFPEKAINTTSLQKDSIITLFRAAAADSKTILAGGITLDKPQSRQNLVEFIFPDGTVQEYKKVFHVKGFEDGFERGNNVGFLNPFPVAAGTAICKDLDYPDWLRKYRDVKIMFVPAWDFEVDGWLHGRMALMRGIENGFTVVRTARQGLLTVSDYCGRVLAETSCTEGQRASLLAEAPLYSVHTLYQSWGDWFGILSVIVAAGWLMISGRKK
jgi:apolipoprotein N-acyltransferase